MKKLFYIGCFCLAFASCEPAEGQGEKFKVEFFSGGMLVRTYISHRVQWRRGSDVYRFVDETGKMVEVAGQVIITELD